MPVCEVPKGKVYKMQMRTGEHRHVRCRKEKKNLRMGLRRDIQRKKGEPKGGVSMEAKEWGVFRKACLEADKIINTECI